MTTIIWNATTKQFHIEFDADNNRDALKAAIKATPGATIWRFEALDSVPVDPTPENIVTLWVSGYIWHDVAAQEAVRCVMPVVQKHLFLQSK